VTPEERTELERLRELEQADAPGDPAKVAELAAARARMWDGPPAAPPPPPRIASARGIGDHGEFLVDAARTHEELVEDHGLYRNEFGQVGLQHWDDA
jgi:hypothetical protein